MHSLTVCCDSTFTYSLCVYNNLLKKELVYILIGYKPVLFLSIYIIFTIYINHSIFPYYIHIFFHYLCIQYLYSIPHQLYTLYIQAILLHQFTASRFECHIENSNLRSRNRCKKTSAGKILCKTIIWCTDWKYHLFCMRASLPLCMANLLRLFPTLPLQD